jgi:hypothetical protein
MANTGNLNERITFGVGLKSIQFLLKKQFQDDGSINIIQKMDDVVEVTVNFPSHVA